uniref:Uncharacterized protein n=1 Tax=Astyanax mexicanus TaxID=7994 RepID=A0A8B9GZ11_ASTMX
MNPASLLPTPEDEEPHGCQLLLLHTCTPRIDLKEEPLFNFMAKSLDFLRQKSVDIALRQETQLKIPDVHRCQNRHYRIAASSSAPNKTKGVSILIKRNLNLNILESGADSNGRFSFIKCNFDSVKMCIFSVYAPNHQGDSFYDSLKQVVTAFLMPPTYPKCV